MLWIVDLGSRQVLVNGDISGIYSFSAFSIWTKIYGLNQHLKLLIRLEIS